MVPAPRVQLALAFVLIMMVVTLAAGCGGSDVAATSTPPPQAQASPTPTATPRPLSLTPTPTPLPTVTPVALTSLKVADIPGLGQVITDSVGRTLYVFDRDTPGATACTGGCLASWPPLIAVVVPSTAGVSARTGLFARAGVGNQVTINDRPLYYYFGDKVAGDITGQGAGEVWWAVSPDGFPVGMPPATGSSSPTVPAGPTALPATAVPPTPTPAGPVEVLNISNFRLPSIIVIAGTSITWINRDADAHTVVHGTSEKPGSEFESPALSTGASYSHKFTEPGTYEYFCSIHSDMTGRVLVNAPPSATTPTPQATSPVPPGPSTPTQTPAPTPALPTATPTATPDPLLERTSIAGSNLPNLVIKSGATVEWTNLDSPAHTVTQGSPGNITGMFDSGSLTLGQKFTFQFVVPGTFAYFCKKHPTMQASVIVTP